MIATPDGDDLEIISSTNGANGTVTIDDQGTADTTDDQLIYTPDADFNGTDSFTYTVSDGNGGTDTATVSVTVGSENDAPIAVGDDNVSTLEDTAVSIDVLGNDSDPDGDDLEIISSTNGANGTVTIDDQGTADTTDDQLIYTPDADFNGTDSFTYTVSDGNGGTDTATVLVTVGGVNDTPIAVSDDNVSTLEDTAVSIDVLGNDSDPDGDDLEIVSFTNGANGTVTIDDNGTADTTDDQLIYTPDADFNGTDSFTYTVSDGNGGTNAATVIVTVNPVTDNPVANDDPEIVTDEDTAVTIDALGNDTNPDGNTLFINNFTQPSSGSVVNNGDGTFTYTPDANFNGTDSFTYGVINSNSGTDTATVTVTVNPVNDNPVANDDPGVATDEDTAVTINVLGNDTDVDVDDTLSISGVNQPNSGSVSINGNGTLTYNPDANFNGTDTFTYTVSDGNGGTDTATVTVRVDNENDAPIAVDDDVSILENQFAFIDAAANDFDPDDRDRLGILNFTQGNNGSVVRAGSILRYTPDANFFGTDSFIYTVTDSSGATDTATVNIEVLSDGNIAPIAGDDQATTDIDTAVTIDYRANDFDPDSNTIFLNGLSQPSSGSVTTNAENNRFIYTPNAGFSGTDTFTYILSDGGNRSNRATVTVTVLDLNDAPVISNLPTNISGDENTNLTFDVQSTDDSDSEGNGLTYAIVGGADAAFFSINSATGLISLVAQDFENPLDADGNNSYIVDVRVTDSDAASSSIETLTVNILDVLESTNTAPVLDNLPTDISVEENAAIAFDVDATDDSDSEGNGLTYEIVGGADAALFSIDSATGLVSLGARDFEDPQDADGNNSYIVDVQVTDSEGASSSIETLTVNILDVLESTNTAPVLDNLPTDISVEENAAIAFDVAAIDDSDSELNGGLTYEIVGGADAALFSINASTGVVSLAAQDFEAPLDADGNNSYIVDVQVTDSEGASSSIETLTVNILDVLESTNTAPVLDNLPTDISVEENAAIAFDVAAIDDSDSELNGGLTYEIVGGADAALFSINASTGVVSLAAQDFEAPLDADGNNSYIVDVQVTDSEGASSSIETLTVNILDVLESTNTAPVLDNLPTDISVEENAAIAFDVDATDDSDSEGNGGLTYEIVGGADAALFSIDSATGLVSLGAQDFEAPLDADGNNSYIVDVQVTDSEGAFSSIETLTVNILDVLESTNTAPVLDNLPTNISVEENAAIAFDVTAIDDSDSEGSGLTYAIVGGADEALFSINASTGVVSLGAQDFEKSPGC